MLKSVQPRPRVIVRSWGDEPVALLLYAIDIQANRVMVGSDTSKRPIGLPSADVSLYDDDVFDRMKLAFFSGDMSALEIIYAEQIMRGNVCNIYQDKAVLGHG